MDAERIEKLRTTYMLGCRTDELGIEVFDALRSLRSQLATLSVGKAWVPEPTKVERTTELLMAYPVSADWGTGFDQGVAWARAHAVAVAPQASCTTCSGAHCCSVVGDPPGCTQGEGVLSWMPWTMEEIQKYVDAAARRAVLPELTEAEEEEARKAWASDRRSPGTIRFGYNLARSSISTIGPDQVVVGREEWDAMCALGFDPEPCRLDHHGYCQEHNWFSKEPCPTKTLQRLYSARKAAP